MSAKPTVQLFTDGACSGNPGPGGWGVLAKHEKGQRECFGGEPETTNNRMELMAVIAGLEMLKKPCTVEIVTDSQYVLKGYKEWMPGWKARGWVTGDKKPVKNQDLWMRLDRAAQVHSLDWTWVKGHNGHPENERADFLARQGVEAQRALRVPPSTPKP